MIGLVDEPLEIDWTPEFMRSFGGAMLDSPGPLDQGQKTFFSITPVPDDWPPELVESYLREMNTRQMSLLVIHEAVPGHYLQMVYANRGSSLARRVFRSGLFAEGWAVYVTQVMLDRGYGDGDPALWLNHWKYYLRCVTNTILDVRIHTMGMTTDEAVALMVDGAFQERAEAVQKDERARLSSTQLSTYFLGSLGIWDIEHEARRRAAVAAGASADSVPTPRVVGGYPDTAGLRPARPPRGRDLARRPADPDPAPDPARRGVAGPRTPFPCGAPGDERVGPGASARDADNPPQEASRLMNDEQVLATATARYEAFRVLLPRVLDDLKAVIDARDVKLGFETRAVLASAAADAAARLVVGNTLEPGS